MCGIAGFVGGGNREVAEAMQRSLRHRGPDAGRAEMCGEVGLAHRRLSVIDLSAAGTQPMHTADGRYSIVYNGEVYNYRELREKYLAGEKLHSETDTEVILMLFSKLGTKAFDHLEGMYALAIYDNQEETLFLHRDRMGKKPLFYTQLPDTTVIFGSELKALKQHPKFRGEVDHGAVMQYLLYEYVPTPFTIYQGVNKLKPGEILTVQNSTVTSSMAAPMSSADPISLDPILDLEKLFLDAVAKRLVADVPVGIFLSGGLDSSLVAAVAQKQATESIKTFSIGFEDESFNEQSAAQAVADHIGSEHFQATLGHADIIRLLPSLPEVLDEPMGDSSIIPTLLVSEHAKKQVIVCLSGDGADELFLGYGTFYAHKWAETFQYLPYGIKKVLFDLVQFLPVSHSYMSFDFKLKRFLKGCLFDEKYRNAVWLSAIDPDAIAALLEGGGDQGTLFDPVNRWHQGAGSTWEGIKREYLQGYLLDDILVKTDRASMRYGLEVRSPFLDERVVAFAGNLDDSLKLHGRTGKYILRQLADSYLPREIIWRKKQGFNFPIGAMIREELKGEFQSALLEGGLQKIGGFKRDRLESLLEVHISGGADHRKALWSLYVLSKWAERWT